MIRSKLLTVSGSGDGYIGERVYEDAPGVFTFTVPAGIRAIHACAVGAGGHDTYDGGGGGGLAWANSIPVEPGEKLEVRAGQSLTSGSDLSHSGIYRAILDENGDPVLDWQDEPRYTMLLEGRGGEFNNGGSFGAVAGVDSGGGEGGDGSLYYNNNVNSAFGSGAGAGGYDGAGGDGGGGAPAPNSGGTSGGTQFFITSGNISGTRPGAVGGGVGIRGRGTTATAPPRQGSGEPARAGKPGSGGDGKEFGGGGHPGEMGGHGAVRIIWGIRFSYPDNADIEAVE